jgi:Gram-negative porin
MCRTLARAIGIVVAVSQMVSSSSPSAWATEDSLGCCGDLENVIMRLTPGGAGAENTGATFRIYGQVNRALLFWDDGKNSKTYAVDNDTSSSRTGVIGKFRPQEELVAGYRIEIDLRATSSWEVSNGEPWGGLDDGAIRLRHAHLFLETGLGRITAGQQSAATDDITLINLGSQMNDAALHYNNRFGIWLNIGSGIITDLQWGQIAHNVDALRGLFVRYDAPLMSDVILSAAVGEEGIWDVAARYYKDWSPFRLAAGVGYMDNPDQSFRDVRGSASLIHDSTGLYASVAGSLRYDDISALSKSGQAYFHYAQMGVSRQWLSYGKTTLYADYGFYKNFNVGHLLRADLVNPGQLAIWGTLAETEVQRWGFGAEQALDRMNVLLYAQAHHYQARVVGFPCDTVPAPSAAACGGDPTNLAVLPTRQWSGFVAGAVIRF